jgi:S-ribosylhomocysteine lyase LuxS involved in autoinducer biosynthesis
MPVRFSAPIGQAVEAANLATLEDLVAGLARDIKLSAYHGLLLEQLGNESETFIHLGTLLARHSVLPAKAGVLHMSAG